MRKTIVLTWRLYIAFVFAAAVIGLAYSIHRGRGELVIIYGLCAAAMGFTYLTYHERIRG